MKIALTAIALLLSLSAQASAEVADKSIKICNQASSRVTHVFATHVDRRNYGRDLLSGNIQPGNCRVIDPGPSEGYCLLDWKVVLDDGRYFENRRVNSCTAETLTLYDRGQGPTSPTNRGKDQERYF